MTDRRLSASFSTGPLNGVRVVELGGIGPAPFAGMTLADMGAEVIRIEPPGHENSPGAATASVLNRNKDLLCLNLKHPDAVRALLALVKQADILIEGYRPGVAERLGVGPDACLDRNRALVYGRMTGWGQDGPMAPRAGHDLNYIAMTGALHAIGQAGGPPQIPVNLVGDFGGGATYLVMGVLAALHQARATGRGQVVDAAIVDGVSHLLAVVHGMLNAGRWRDERGVNMLDGGAPYYSVYETADGGHVSVAAIEPKFFAQLLEVLQIELDASCQEDRSTWAAMREMLEAAFRSRTRDEWASMFAGTDACVTPVLSLQEAAANDHIRARGSIRQCDGFIEPGEAPRFSSRASTPGRQRSSDPRSVLGRFGLDAESLFRSGAAHVSD